MHVTLKGVRDPGFNIKLLLESNQKLLEAWPAPPTFIPLTEVQPFRQSSPCLFSHNSLTLPNIFACGVSEDRVWYKNVSVTEDILMTNP